MGIDLVVTSLSTDWSRYARSSLPLLSSLDRLVSFGEAPLPYDPSFAERAFREASRSGSRRGAEVRVAIERFQEALSIRFDRTIAWRDPGDLEEDYRGQIAPSSSLAVHDIVEREGRDRFPNLAVLDIENMILPVELPTVLIGQPRRIGSCPALQREIEAVRTLLDPEEDVLAYHLDELDAACRDAIASGAVVIVSG